ncbi:uncharacterized protein LAESUDRAFT_761524 [Laetiporus sulphureus 93-53]|uniref:Uncharacterized protein n=1 Tax=Laetiporus sulphureus 93-53 TaxID=1314785 RepID=A0A165D151_9APHY|nr:uncharacterized protein LAESUDRAFT_761524 [Laetiporus sulphureus 93-53]KZT03930.1 hypothetical protein LAESUDRAFT_761524 [Laetiporus sulphureus 93-53]
MPASAHRRRFKNSLDMVAARPEVFVDLVTSPSSTDNARSMVDSPVLGQLSGVALSNKDVDPLRVRRAVPAVHVAPLNVKKKRRKALLSGAHLYLPASPLPPATPGLTPQTSLTFTAEWSATQRGFLFTPLTNESLRSDISPRSPLAYIPDDVDEAFSFHTSGHCLDGHLPSTPLSCSSASSILSDSTSLFIHERKPSAASTALTSVYEEPIQATPYSLPTESAVHCVESEITRIAAGSEPLARSYLRQIDDDVLLDPWRAFESSCWSSMEMSVAPVAAFPLSPLVSEKVVPDVPTDTLNGSIFESDEGNVSRFSADGHPMASTKARKYGPLRFHCVSKAFKLARWAC